MIRRHKSSQLGEHPSLGPAEVSVTLSCPKLFCCWTVFLTGAQCVLCAGCSALLPFGSMVRLSILFRITLASTPRDLISLPLKTSFSSENTSNTPTKVLFCNNGIATEDRAPGQCCKQSIRDLGSVLTALPSLTKSHHSPS